MAMVYRSCSQTKDLTSSDSEEENSENEQSWKHRPSKPRPVPEPEVEPSLEDKKKQATKVWVNVLMEQSLSDNLTHCEVQRFDMVPRECESYQLPPQEDQELKHFNDLLRGLPELPPAEARRADKLAMQITRQLKERKHMLIKRCVYILGVETCSELLKETKEIEKNGGMLIKNGKRRRTAGGVFLHLLRSSPSIPEDKKTHVFEQEESLFQERKNVKMKNGQNFRRWPRRGGRHPLQSRNKAAAEDEGSMDVEPAGGDASQPGGEVEDLEEEAGDEEQSRDAEMKQSGDAELEEGEINDLEDGEIED